MFPDDQFGSLSGFEKDHDDGFKDEIFVKTSLAKSLVLDHITDMELQKKTFFQTNKKQNPLRISLGAHPLTQKSKTFLGPILPISS